jgi:hypothetical protein
MDMYASLAKHEHSKLEKKSAKHKKANVADSESDDEMSVSIISTHTKVNKKSGKKSDNTGMIAGEKDYQKYFHSLKDHGDSAGYEDKSSGAGSSGDESSSN